MFSRKIAQVVSVDKSFPQFEELTVSMADQISQAINYPSLTGAALVGDKVVLNTTAVELTLGSGGFHFVYLNLERLEQPLAGAGHIIKLRYTPAQLRVLSVEEEQSPHHAIMATATSLLGMPVVSGELHSMLAPVALTIKQEKPGVRLAYLMTDGGALPAFFSRTLRELRAREVIIGTITTGHAFGGDLEAVNVFSGLLAARYVLKADAAMICMGPGVAGTGTPFGFSGLEMGENINRIHSLGGHAIALPRLSFADSRPRHQGLSHHTLTALATAALAPADVPLPRLSHPQDEVIAQQVLTAGWERHHNLVYYPELSLSHLEPNSVLCTTMGRTLAEDPAFFLGCVAAGVHLTKLLCNSLVASEAGS